MKEPDLRLRIQTLEKGIETALTTLGELHTAIFQQNQDLALLQCSVVLADFSKLLLERQSHEQTR